MSKRTQESNVFSREATRLYSIFQHQETRRGNEPSSSASARKLERGEDIQIGRSKMQISDHQYLENIFKICGQKLNLAEEAPMIGIEALTTNVLIWGLFTSTTMKAATDLGPNYTEILKVYRNTKLRETSEFV